MSICLLFPLSICTPSLSFLLNASFRCPYPSPLHPLCSSVNNIALLSTPVVLGACVVVVLSGQDFRGHPSFLPPLNRIVVSSNIPIFALLVSPGLTKPFSSCHLLVVGASSSNVISFPMPVSHFGLVPYLSTLSASALPLGLKSDHMPYCNSVYNEGFTLLSFNLLLFTHPLTFSCF